MGFSNGTSKTDKRVEKGRPQGPPGERGIGFHLTADNQFNIRNRRLMNVGHPVESTDAVTRKFVTDLLKTKASTTYLKSELGKKADKSDYVLKSDLNKAISEINKAITELNTLISALKPKV